MTTHLISLISENLLPNFLLAKEFEGKYDRHIFVTNQRMGKQSMTSRLCKSLGIDKKDVQIVVVSEDDLPDVLSKLKKELFSEDDKYIVNLTGGTKIMSIGIFTHFITYKENADFYYIPIGVNKIETVLTGQDLPLNYRIDVEEYLALYGLNYEHSTQKPVLKGDAGSAFEAQIYSRIKNEKALRNGCIYRGVKLFGENSERNSDNEIDVMWTTENRLYVGECKVSLFKPQAIDDDNRLIYNPAEYLDEIMYKLAAISKNLGITVNPYIFIKKPLSSNIFNGDRMAAIQKRMKILGIKGLIDGNALKQMKLAKVQIS
jgi:hypothetical protein